MPENDKAGATDSRVSSNWALRLPSIVVAVQLSGQWISSQLVPKLSICQIYHQPGGTVSGLKRTGSMVKTCGRKSINDWDNEKFQWRGLTIPGFIVPTALFFA